MISSDGTLDGVSSARAQSAPASLAARYRTTRATIVAERARLTGLAARLRAAAIQHTLVAPDMAASRRSAALTGPVVEHMVRGCFHVARLVDRALADEVFGERADPDNDSFVNAHEAEAVFEHLKSAAAVVRQWGRHEFDSLLAELEEGTALLDRLAAEDRQILLFDTRGGGQIAEVIGDLFEASHVVVVVPGMGTTAQKFESAVSERARRLSHAATERAKPDSVAVLGWLGYTAPGSLDVVDAAVEHLALQGAAALSAFVSEVASYAPHAHRSVVAHSYGSVVAGLAARHHGLPIDDLIVLGSPGLGVASARDLRINAGGKVWALRARRDPVTSVPRLQHGPVRFHGASPYDDSFGSRIIAIDDEGHSSYLNDDGAVEVIARIVVGEDPLAPPSAGGSS